MMAAGCTVHIQKWSSGCMLTQYRRPGNAVTTLAAKFSRGNHDLAAIWYTVIQLSLRTLITSIVCLSFFNPAIAPQLFNSTLIFFLSIALKCIFVFSLAFFSSKHQSLYRQCQKEEQKKTSLLLSQEVITLQNYNSKSVQLEPHSL